MKKATVLAMACCFATMAMLSAPCPAADATAPSAGLVLKKQNRLAMIGDSITEQKLYTRFVEQYLTACRPDLEILCFQFGKGRETAGAFKDRMENDLVPFKPDVVTSCYGMNDGGYGVWKEDTGKAYAVNMTAILDRVKKAGGVVVVGSPGAVDSEYYRTRRGDPDVYNDTLKHLTAIDQDLATRYGWPFANVHDTMMSAMAKAKAAKGKDYDVCGRDGIHPNPNGHLLMAYALLKALGCDGNLATITLDMKGKATATEGHKVLAAEPGKAEIESSRYPFCFFGSEGDSGGTRSILPFVAFNEELNRFMLVVNNLDGGQYKVTWGSGSKSLSKADLEKGINLAAEFPDNPFSEPFRKVGEAVGEKQTYETAVIQNWITKFPSQLADMGHDKEFAAALEVLRHKWLDRQARMAADVRATVKPVKHSLLVVKE